MIAPAVPSNVKRCSKCGVYKLRANFVADKSSKDGLRGSCKFCNSEAHRKKPRPPCANCGAGYRLPGTKLCAECRRDNPKRGGKVYCPKKSAPHIATCECGNKYSERWNRDDSGCPECRSALAGIDRSLDAAAIAERNGRRMRVADPLCRTAGFDLMQETDRGYKHFWGQPHRLPNEEPPPVPSAYIVSSPAPKMLPDRKGTP